VAEQVVPHVVNLAKGLGLRVILVSVTFPTEDAYRAMGYPVTPYGDLSWQVDAQAEGYFQQIRENLHQQGVSQVEEKLLHGHPAGAIVDLARKTPSSLIAMATHGRSGVGRWVLGSVTDRVIRHSGGPILVIRAVPEE